MAGMTGSLVPAFDPALDLSFDRQVDVPPGAIFRAWTTPEELKQWFTPAPWKTVDCEIDLRPGGIFRTTMRSPEGQEFGNAGSYLEIVPNERLVWTNALLPGFRPVAPPAAPPGAEGAPGFFAFTAIISLAPHAGGTLYTARVLHGDAAACKRHEQMGYREGWGKALDQLVAMVKARA
jgi:uncharacterized protein YndB with AHSA1/START domain